MTGTPGGVQRGVALGDSVPFSLHRDEEGPEELKGQNWELPLQDGESLL